MHLFRIAQRMAAAVRGSGLRCEGINLFLADGEAAGQDVFHVHLHVVPRFQGDAVVIDATFGHPTRAELDADAIQIVSASTRADYLTHQSPLYHPLPPCPNAPTSTPS